MEPFQAYLTSTFYGSLALICLGLIFLIVGLLKDRKAVAYVGGALILGGIGGLIWHGALAFINGKLPPPF